jgi:hypothetical protein
MPITTQEIESFAKTAWPHVAAVSIDVIAAGRRKPNEFEPLDSGFTLTAYDAGGSIVKRFSAANLVKLKEMIEKQVRKTKQRYSNHP